MEATLESTIITDDLQDEKMSSFNHSELQSHLAFLFRAAYRHQYSILTELDFDFASGKTRPDLCIMPKRRADWLADEIVVQDAPLTTIEILSPEQSLNSLTDRIYKKHFPAGVKTVWLVVPTVQTVSILLPDRKQINFAQGIITDPVTNIQLDLSEIFEG
jgi:Uma2 family endonuclease